MPEPEVENLLSRLGTGLLTPAERNHLAALLRQDPALRQRVRQQAIAEVRLRQVVRKMPRPRLRHTSQTLRPRWWPWIAVAASAACLLFATGIWLTPDREPASDLTSDQEIPETNPVPPTIVAASGPFTLPDRSGTVPMPDQTRIDLEPGSSGSVSSPANATPVMTLASGGARLHHLDGKPEGTEACQIKAGATTVTASGDVAVRYLQVPDGFDPAIEVRVGQGHAQVDVSGVRHELGRNSSKVIAPGGEIRAQVQLDAARHEVVFQASGGRDRIRWKQSLDHLPPITLHHRSLMPNALQSGWQVHLKLDPAHHDIIAIDVPDQRGQGTLSAWEPQSRLVTIVNEPHGQNQTWPVPAAMTFDSTLIGKRVRFTYDAENRMIRKLSLREEQTHPH
jgi:hypothetical protein